MGNPLQTALTKANKTVSIIDYSNVIYKKIKDRCLYIKESSEILKKDILNFPSDSDDVVMSIKRKLMDTDDNEYKRRIIQEKDNEIYNDVIEDKDKGNKKYNEQQFESMRTSTKRILKELNCIQKINPYIAYVGGDTVKRIFSIKIDSTFDDDSGKDHNYFLPLKNKKKENKSNAQVLLSSTNKMERLVQMNIKLRNKVSDKLEKCNSSLKCIQRKYII